MQGKSADLARLTASLAHLDPSAVLARGYCIVTNARGEIIGDSRTLEPSQSITVFFGRGRAEAAVQAVFAGDGGESDLGKIASAAIRK